MDAMNQPVAFPAGRIVDDWPVPALSPRHAVRGDMSKQNIALYGLNHGEISKHALGRVDVDRLRDLPPRSKSTGCR
jgi:hypothetical protein